MAGTDPLPVVLVIVLFGIFSLSHAQPPEIEVGKFSAEAVGDRLPAGWKPLTFKKIEKHTVYTLVRDDDAIVVRAIAEASASGLIREIKINPKEYPVVQWRG